MLKKTLFMLLALLQLLAVNLTLRTTVTVDGKPLPGTFSTAQISRAQAVSVAVAEELGAGEAYFSHAVEYKKKLCLSPAEGDPRLLTDALLCSLSGVTRACELWQADRRLGVVADPEGFAYTDLTLRPVYSSTERVQLSGLSV